MLKGPSLDHFGDWIFARARQISVRAPFSEYMQSNNRRSLLLGIYRPIRLVEGRASAGWHPPLPGLAPLSCSSLLRPPPGTDRVSGPLGACRGARAVAVLVPSATAPTFKRQIEPAQAPPTRALDVRRHTHHRSATPPSPPAVVGWQGHVLPPAPAPAAPSRP